MPSASTVGCMTTESVKIQESTPNPSRFKSRPPNRPRIVDPESPESIQESTPNPPNPDKAYSSERKSLSTEATLLSFQSSVYSSVQSTIVTLSPSIA